MGYINKILKLIQKYPVKTILICLFLISFALRVWMTLHHDGFAQDQGRDLMIMQDFARYGVIFVDYGPKASVDDFYLPPFFYQIHYWVDLLSGSWPLAMKWVVTLIESFSPL